MKTKIYFQQIIILLISSYAFFFANTLHAEGPNPFVPQENTPQPRAVPYEEAQANRANEVQVVGGSALTPDQRDQVQRLCELLENNAAQYEAMSKEANREVSESIFSSIVNETQPRKADVTEARSDGTGPSSFKGTVVNEDAKKNEQIQKLFFDPGFLARGLWTAPGDATSNMFPKTNRLPVSLVEEGARRANQFVKDRYSAVKDQLGKDKTDEKLRERIDLVRQLKEKINEDAFAVPVARKNDQYLVVDSVEISKELAAVYYLLHPPQQLHPYLRYLLYTRLVDPQVMHWYLAMIEKINAIHKTAKAGNGKIRYKGKIVGTFRPMPYDMGGAYELVTDLPKTEKAQLDKDIFPGQ